MEIQMQFKADIGVIVDTETGVVTKVIVWDDSPDFTTPTKAYRDEYLPGATEAHPYGRSVFEELPLDHPEVVTAMAVIANPEKQEWPGWDFGA